MEEKIIPKIVVTVFSACLVCLMVGGTVRLLGWMFS